MQTFFKWEHFAVSYLVPGCISGTWSLVLSKQWVKQPWVESWALHQLCDLGQGDLASLSLSLYLQNGLILVISYCWLLRVKDKKYIEGLPWWRSGWESACQCRGHGFEPWPGKIPYAAEQLGLWATTAEPARLEPVLRNKRGRDGERPAHRDEEWPPLAATRESPHTETKTQHSHK